METYATWHADPAREPAMEESHRPLWRHFIQAVPESDLSTRDVLDFGCNRDGFLRLLHALKPFRSGVGVDIAEDSIRAAQALSGATPATFKVATDLAPWSERFDLAFSYEVIYLLPDLAGHAAGIHAVLRPGGVYYAVTGCHNGGPLWPALRDTIGSTTNAPVQDRSPEDYAACFDTAGFEVSVRRFGFEGFIPARKHQRYFPRMTDEMDYYARDKLLFRMARRDVPAP